MNFSEPQPWLEIIREIEAKKLLPTSAGSAELSGLAADVRKYSIFSARTTSAGYLEELRKLVAQFASGQINMADFIMHAQEKLKELGYNPDTGFPDAKGQVPPAQSLLQNLASDRRIRLMADTLSRHATSTAYLQGGMTPGARFDFPCWEFSRQFDRQHPRGESGRENDPDWHARWVRSGGKLYGGRMIAKKDDPVWAAISDSGVWSDGLDSDSDPVVFNTGYARHQVPRAECVRLGVIAAGDNVGAENIRLIGQMFDDPNKATLADLRAKKQDLLAALAGLRDAA